MLLGPLPIKTTANLENASRLGLYDLTSYFHWSDGNDLIFTVIGSISGFNSFMGYVTRLDFSIVIGGLYAIKLTWYFLLVKLRDFS